MVPKHKATAYNFFSFAVFFISLRLLIGFFFPGQRFVLALVAAILASLAAPKFAAVKTETGEKIFIKWPFKKNPKEL